MRKRFLANRRSRRIEVARTNIPGTVYRRPNGRYTALSPEVYDADQRRWRRISLGTFGTERDALEALIGFDQDRRRSSTAMVAAEVQSQRLDCYLDEWLQSIEDLVVNGRLARRTATGYESAVRLHIKPALGRYVIGDLSERIVSRWLADLRRQGLADRTVRRIYWTLCGALEEANLDTNPVRLPPRLSPTVVNRKETYRPPVDEIRQFLRHVVECPRSRYLYPLWRLAAVTGMRRAELVAVTWSDVDLVRSRLHVERSIVMDRKDLIVKPPKSGAGTRTIGLDAPIVAALGSYRRKLIENRLAHGEGYDSRPLGLDLVFRWDGSGTLCRPDRVSTRFTQEWKHSGLDSPATLHSLRHSLGSLLLASNHPITEVAAQLGHDPHVLLAIYGRDLDSEKRVARVVETVEALFA